MSNAPATFTVIIPWHGNWGHLLRAAASVARQTDQDFELIVVCNGKAADLGSEVLARRDLPPCRVLSSQPADAQAARNTGIDAACGTWLALLDADDEFEPEKLSAMRRAIDAGGADILLSRGSRIRSDAMAFVYPKRLLEAGDNMSEYFFSHGCNCSTTAVVVRADVARRVRFTPGLPKFQDNDFLIRAQAAGARIGMLADPLYRWHDANEGGRISRGADYERQMAWARSLAPAFTARAYHAFCARRVAQYTLPGDLVANVRRFWNGWRHGGLSATETGLMILRGLLPKGLARRGVDLYARMAQPGRLRTGRDRT